MWMSVDNEEISLAVCNLLQTITDCLLGQGKEEHHGKEEALVLGNGARLGGPSVLLLEEEWGERGGLCSCMSLTPRSLVKWGLHPSAVQNQPAHSAAPRGVN